jgi:hypothetical protein
VTVSKSASIAERLLRASLLAAALLVTAALPARAEMMGHVNVGYGRLFADGAPGGSLAMSGGFDWPVVSGWRVGLDVGYSLLGSSNENRGSLFANIDYSALNAYAVGIWQPTSLGPVERVTVGAGIMNALAEIASAGGGAAFRDLAREGVVPAALIGTTLMSRTPSPVRAGLELSARIGFLDEETWVIACAGVAFHY